MQTVLVVGSSGNIGVAAIIGALRTKRNVLAVVRNQNSADKVLRHVEAGVQDAKKSITFATADVTSDNGIQSVVDQVKAGSLPAFQHVYSTVGAMELTSPIQNLTTEAFRKCMNISFESNFFAYRATVPYLIEQGNKDATWTLMTGGAGETGWAGVTAMSQGALFSMANVACRETKYTNVRFNEVFLNFRVEVDEDAEKNGPDGRMKASKFSEHYQKLLESPDVRASRMLLNDYKDVETPRYTKKLEKI